MTAGQQWVRTDRTPGSRSTRQDLFQLLSGVSPGYHLIDLTVPAGFRIYTFTFG